MNEHSSRAPHGDQPDGEARATIPAFGPPPAAAMALHNEGGAAPGLNGSSAAWSPEASAAAAPASSSAAAAEARAVGMAAAAVAAPLPSNLRGVPEAAGSARFTNRELSWIDFNQRVFAEAENPARPLLERIKFLAIYGSNLDEFMMVRLPALRSKVKAGVSEPGPDGIPPSRLLAELRAIVARCLENAARLLREVLIPALAEQGVLLVRHADLNPRQQAALRDYFEQDVFPVCTPLGFDPAHPFPFISNQSTNLAVLLLDPELGRRFARVKIPTVLPRLVEVPPDAEATPLSAALPQQHTFIWLDDLLAAHLGAFFPGVAIEEAHPFRVLRQAELAIQELEAADLLELVESGVQQRRFGEVTALQVQPSMPAALRTLLLESIEVEQQDLYVIDGVPGLSSLMELTALPRPDLKDAPFVPRTPIELTGHEDMFEAIRQQDVLLHHPFDSFDPVVEFIRKAALDPGVVAIKQTLYRVGQNSPIVEALLEAAEWEKQVTVLVELKARFDEEHNIDWARRLEQAGVHVVYGLLGLKVHCKLALVVRREREGLRRYVHIGTGNYNAATARAYTDLGLLTCRPEIGADVSEIFNYLTGYSRQTEYRRLLVAPVNMRHELLRRIDREIGHARRGGHARLIFKMNALVDPEMIDALYRASAAGVQVDLIVRGICCLRPGAPGLSETIRVVSIVGRLLEHSRLYYFHNGGGGEEELLLGSADLMPRNLDYRVETLAPVEDAGIKRYLVDDVLNGYLHDNVQATLLGPDGIYRRPQRGAEEPRIDMQARLINAPDLLVRRMAESDDITTSWHSVDRPRPLWIDE
ncbi:MAG TPA: polyphosphate kinase 1 [Dehalococcoidia bacterium]|nr:polyphosphate kinase 1 [Dehalococcoidia bacterium]